MQRRIWYIVTILGVFISGCATYQVSGMPTGDQRLVYRDGHQTIISLKENAVAVSVKEDTLSGSDRLEFIVAVNNRTSEELTFSTENISATANNISTLETFTLHVYTYDELVAEEEKRRTWEIIGAAISGAADSYSAAYAGYSTTYGTYPDTTYDYGAAEAARIAANAKTNAEIARIGAEGKATLQELALTILKIHTVFPEEWYGGVIQVDPPKNSTTESKIDLLVYFGEDEHAFRFIRKKIEKTSTSDRPSKTEKE